MVMVALPTDRAARPAAAEPARPPRVCPQVLRWAVIAALAAAWGVSIALIWQARH